MNRQDVLQLNIIPDGKEAWLSYEQYLKLKQLFEMLPLPGSTETTSDPHYLQLHQFLSTVAQLDLPLNEAAIHFNAFALIRRGYKVESITLAEYENLRQLLAGLDEPTLDDTDLYDSGGHQALYDYLTRGMGLPVQRGRGPAWRRARDLLKTYEAEHLIEQRT
jgi:hypothetical protein